MTEEVKPNFLESIKFEEEFLPFEKDTEIKFGGEKEVQRMIEFYLKDKGKKDSKGNIISPEDNAKRFKINCVLGNNGGGKSRLFEWILDKEIILNRTVERKNNHWDFNDLGIFHQKTQSYYLKNSNSSLNICDTIESKTILSDLSTTEELKNSLKSLVGQDLSDKDIHNLQKEDSENRHTKVVNEENYLKNIGKNSKEIMKFSNILDINGKVEKFDFILDDFFKLSGNIDYSVNNILLNEKKYNKFYCVLFNDIGKFQDIYPGFLNIGNDFDTEINFDFQNWKDNYKGDYFDFLNFHNDYNGETDNRNVKDEIDFGKALNLFELLAETYTQGSTSLHKFGIKEEESKEIWLYLSELFLLTVNHFDTYVSTDDQFTKEMIRGVKRFGGEQEGFKEKGLLAYDEYSDYKKALNLLETYLNINLDLIDKYKFKKSYLKDKTRLKEIKISLTQIQENLQILINNLEYIEKNVSGYAKSNKEQKYPFKDINGADKMYSNFIDKLQGSKYSSQSQYLLINLLFGYSDVDQYTSDIETNIFDKKTIKKNQNKIKYLSYYVFDGPILHTSEIITGKKFQYKGTEKLSESNINLINNNFINCDIEFHDNKKSYSKSFEQLSAGEKTMLTRFTNISRNIFDSEHNNFLILIDEPDLHLHLDWQRQYIQKLIDVFSTLDPEINLHFIMATHSPFIISDLPTESIIILDGEENNEHQGTFTKVKNYSKKIQTKNKNGEQTEIFEHQTFGANYIDIIKNGFFFEDKMLMGSFAQANIEKTSKILKAKLFIESLHINDKNFETKKSLLNDILKEIGENKVDDFGEFENYKSKYFEGIENIQNHIGDDFLQDNLMYLN